MHPYSASTGPAAKAGLVWRRWGGSIIGVAVLALLLALAWYLLSGTASTKREAPSTSMLMLPPPPPPPPEPEKLPEPKPEIKPEITEVDPKPVEPLDKPVDEPAPSPSKDLADPISINSDAQAGNDAFGIQAGRGGGSTGGGGLGGGSFNAYVASQLQRVLQRDPRTRSMAFDLNVDIWLRADGVITRVQLVRSTGNEDLDANITAVLRGIERIDERPTPSTRMPMRVTMKGARP
ncbi:MAG: hypothetical protein EOP81_01510 [Variovorax sp.]|nr:MAG: hypothetical protein EOP81_01510 [Variovorax sp.]